MIHCFFIAFRIKTPYGSLSDYLPSSIPNASLRAGTVTQAD